MQKQNALHAVVWEPFSLTSLDIVFSNAEWAILLSRQLAVGICWHPLSTAASQVLYDSRLMLAALLARQGPSTESSNFVKDDILRERHVRMDIFAS